MPHYATIGNLAQATQVIKGMQLRGIEWGEDYRVHARRATVEFLEGQMQFRVDDYLDDMERRGEYDRRNGYYSRHLLTELGDIELAVPRTRAYSAVGVVKAYARRTGDVDRAIMACFTLGVSTRKVALTLLPFLGEGVSATTVSQIAKALDSAVDAFHKRPLTQPYRVLILDGVVLKKRTGAGAKKHPVLVALGLTHDGRKEVIDFRTTTGESQAAWEEFLNDLFRRGLTGEGLELLCVDGGAGLLAALSTVYPHVQRQRCWAHKIRNIIDKVRKVDAEKVKQGLHAIMNAANLTKARSKARAFANKWERRYPKAVACLRNDLDDLLTFLGVFSDPKWRKWVRTTNAIERRFVEVRRRTRPMGVFADRASIERILFAVFTHENWKQGVPTLFPLTQNY